MFTIETDTFAQELVTPLLQCTSPEARGLEWQLLLGMYNNEHFHDDKVVLDYFPVGNGAWLKLFNWNDEKIQATDEQGHESIGHQFLHLIHDLEEDYPKIEDSVFGCDAEGTLRQHWLRRRSRRVPLKRLGRPSGMAEAGSAGIFQPEGGTSYTRRLPHQLPPFF